MLSYTRLCQNYSSRISEFLVTSDIRIRKDIAVNRKGIKNNKHIQTISLDICHSFSLVKRWDIRASAFSRHSCLRMLDGVFQIIYLSEQERERERERVPMYMCMYILSRHGKLPWSTRYLSRSSTANQRTIQERPRSQLTAEKEVWCTESKLSSCEFY